MEIEIDEALVRRILSEERDEARGQIAALGPEEALAQSQRRHDRRLAESADAPTLACRAGCFWCCYFTVDVRPVEVFRILDTMNRDLPPNELARIADEVRRNASTLRALSEEQRGWIRRVWDRVRGAVSGPELPDGAATGDVKVWVNAAMDGAEAKRLYPSLYTGMRALLRLPGDPPLL